MFYSVSMPATGKISLAKTAECLGLSVRRISDLRKKFREKYNDFLKGKAIESTWGGRRKAYLTEEEEKTLLKDLENKAQVGGFVDISIIKKAFEEKAGKVIHKTTLYRFLERHNWRKIAPRRYHPQRNQELQENFKKTSLEF